MEGNCRMRRTEKWEPPQRSWSPNAGLLKSPNRPLGKSSQDAALLSSPRPASDCATKRVARVLVAEVVAFEGVINRSESPSGNGWVGVPGTSLTRITMALFEGNNTNGDQFIGGRRSGRNASSPTKGIQDALDALFQIKGAKLKSGNACSRP